MLSCSIADNAKLLCSVGGFSFIKLISLDDVALHLRQSLDSQSYPKHASSPAFILHFGLCPVV